MSRWTHLMDMHSGGDLKHGAAHFYIEAPEDEARVIFYNRYGTNPDRVTCTCCGEDYSITGADSLEQASAFQRGCRFEQVVGEPGGGHYVEEPDTRYSFHPYRPLSQYLAESGDVVIRAAEIKPDERSGEVPEQGYVWAG